jgi:hypothetical protein
MRGHMFDGLDCDPTTSVEFRVEKGVAGIINFIEGRYVHEGTQRLNNVDVK